MNKIKFLESTIIGFLVGVIAATYIVFMISTNQALGKILNAVSLNPLLRLFPDAYSDSLVINFLFYILVFVIYAILIGFFLGRSLKLNILISLLLIILCCGMFYEEKNTTGFIQNYQEYNYTDQAISILSKNKNTQLFEKETRGDLNNDTTEDIAFILKSNDNQNNTEYYLASSLKSQDGYITTNFIFIEQEIQVESITIQEGIVAVSYTKTQTNINATEDLSVEKFYAKIIDGQLEEIDPPIEQTSSTSTQEILQ